MGQVASSLIFYFLSPHLFFWHPRRVRSLIPRLFTCCNWRTLMTVTHCKNSFWPVNGRISRCHPFLLGVHPKKRADLTTKRLDDVTAIMYHPLQRHVHPPMRCVTMVIASALNCLVFILFVWFYGCHYLSFMLPSLNFFLFVSTSKKCASILLSYH